MPALPGAQGDIKSTFELFAKKKKVAAADIGSIVRSMGMCPTERQLADAIGAAGISGEADVKQVQAVAQALKDTTPGDEIVKMLKSALNYFDPDGAEVVTVSELSHVRFVPCVRSDRSVPDLRLLGQRLQTLAASGSTGSEIGARTPIADMTACISAPHRHLPHLMVRGALRRCCPHCACRRS